jgi:hypothetical protein
MKCPFCKSALTTTYICKGCGADLVILKHLEEGRKKKRIETTSLKSAEPHFTSTQITATQITATQISEVEVPDLSESSWSSDNLTAEDTFHSEMSALSSESLESINTITDFSQAQEIFSFDGYTELHLDNALSPEVRNEIETLFDQLFLSLSDQPCVPQSEITSTDLILRERTEQLDLLFELLHGSFSSSQAKQENEETQNFESKLVKSLPKIVLPEEQVAALLQTNCENLQTSPKDSRNERYIAPSALNSILATIVDLVLSQVLTLFGLFIYGGSSILREPSLSTIPDQIFSITIFLALLVPSFCFFKAAFFLSIGSTPGCFITGIKPVSLDGSKPTRYCLVLLSFTAPFIRLFTIPIFLTKRGTNFLIKLTEVRYTVEK